MECRYILSKFADYLDGDLRPAEQRLVDRHVAQCPSCRRELEALRRFLDDCNEFMACPRPAYSFRHLRARMAAIEPLQEIAAFLPRLKVQGLIPRAAVAMMFLLMVGITPGSLRNTRQLYAFMKSPFSMHTARIDEAYREYLDAPAEEEQEEA